LLSEIAKIVMTLTTKSNNIIKFITQNLCDDVKPLGSNVVSLFSNIHKELVAAAKFVEAAKKVHGDKFYATTVSNVSGTTPISFPPKSFMDWVPQNIVRHIRNTSQTEIVYSFAIFGRSIRVIFVLETHPNDIRATLISAFNRYIDMMIMWMCVINTFSNPVCGKTMTVYLYMTSLKKTLRGNGIKNGRRGHIANITRSRRNSRNSGNSGNNRPQILGRDHINTAMTTTCPENSIIVIYRQEEWFKVFIHETFHTFDLDFSGMDCRRCVDKILKIFPVKSEVRLYEAYTECWAEIMNVGFCSFFSNYSESSKSTVVDVDTFLPRALMLMNCEIQFGLFQMSKTLDYMGLGYTDLYSTKQSSVEKRREKYIEGTSVLSYYIIKCVLMCNLNSFIAWCASNNDNMVQFNKSEHTILRFCEFIEINHKSQSTLRQIGRMAAFFDKWKSSVGRNSLMRTSMKMSACELK